MLILNEKSPPPPLRLCLVILSGSIFNIHCLLIHYACDTWIIIILDAVSIDPLRLVAAVDHNRSIGITCQSPTGQSEGGVVNIQWRLNGMLLEDINLNNVISTLVDGVGGFGGFGILHFSRVRLDQNSTSVSCSVIFMTGRVENSSDSALLLVQG